MRKIIPVIFFICFSIVSYAQQADSTVANENEEISFFKPDNSAPFKFGLKLGVGYSSFGGSEFAKAIGRAGMNGSAYMRYRFKQKWQFQTELGASFRGSNFNNATGEFSSIRMYYIDVPVMIAYAFDKKNNDLIIAGLQYSYLVNSSFYISTSALPTDAQPSLNRNDLMAILGVQFNTPFVGFQILGKYGLVNLNQNQLWPTATQNAARTQPLNTGGTIHNFSLEFNLLF